MSAACGKMGAVVGVFAVAYLEDSYGTYFVLMLLGSIAFLGAVVTLLCIPDTIARSLDFEDECFMEALAQEQ